MPVLASGDSAWSVIHLDNILPVLVLGIRNLLALINIIRLFPAASLGGGYTILEIRLCETVVRLEKMKIVPTKLETSDQFGVVPLYHIIRILNSRGLYYVFSYRVKASIYIISLFCCMFNLWHSSLFKLSKRKL